MHVRTENKYFIFDLPIKMGIKYRIKKMILLLKRFWYAMLFQAIRVKPASDTKYDVSICAIFKDEADYLREWIELHKIVGVEHFYLYNNGSSDHYQEVLKPYILSGEVTLTDWNDAPGQMSSYSDCVRKYGKETKWIAFIDLDEFIVPNTYDRIYDFLKQYDRRYPIVIAYWRSFGTSGRIERNVDGLVTEDFVVSWEKYTNIGKCFYNTGFSFADEEKVNRNNVHKRWGKYKNILLPPVNCYGKICLANENPVGRMPMPIQINHYLLKSYGEYTRKKSKRGDAIFTVDMHNMDYFYLHEKKAVGVDYHIYKYMIQLKLKLQKESCEEAWKKNREL